MSDDTTFEQQILDEFGLSDSDLRNYLAKLDAFFEELTSNEKKIFLASMTTLEQAATYSREKISPEELEEFIKEREPTDASVLFIIHLGQRSHEFETIKPKKAPVKKPTKKVPAKPSKKPTKRSPKKSKT